MRKTNSVNNSNSKGIVPKKGSNFKALMPDIKKLPKGVKALFEGEIPDTDTSDYTILNE